MLVAIRSASFFDSIFGTLEIEDKLYRVVGTRQGTECFRDNDAGGQESYNPREYYTDRLCESDDYRYWVCRRSNGTLYREATTNTSGIGKWIGKPETTEFYLDMEHTRIIWKTEIKENTEGSFYILN
jgi:hypothetical protein